MKIRFDTYTKDVSAAASALASLYAYCPEITVSKDSWREGVLNVTGEIDSSNMSVLEKALPDETFNEDTDKL